MSRYEADDFGDAGQTIKEAPLESGPKKVTYRSWLKLRREAGFKLPWNSLRTVFIAGVHFNTTGGIVRP